jgi:hypothetical protein
VVEPPTDRAGRLKVALDAPALTVTLAGGTAAGLSLISETRAPPAGAEPVSVTVPVVELPPATLAGFRVNPDSATPGAIVSGAVLVTPFKLALI